MQRPNPFLFSAILLASLTPSLLAEDFDLSAVIRAGANSGGWDFAVGPAGDASSNSRSLSPYYGNNYQHAFQIGYLSSTNSAYLRLQTRNGQWREVTYAPGGVGLGAGSIWTIPATDLYVTAEGKAVPTSVTVSSLALGPGLTVLNPLSTTLAASQQGSTVTQSSPNPVMFQTTGNGDWVVSGLIAFTGLSSYAPGGANGDQLRFGFSAFGTSTPEPATAATLAAGALLLAAGAAIRKRTAARD